MKNPAPANSIFICYRRKDSSDIAGRIYDRFVQRFGENAVFKDVDTVPLGVDFRIYIDRIIKECAFVLVIIGDRWLDADANGKRRIDNPRDHVRVEIETALKRDIPVIPLLVREAVHPDPDTLPESVRELAYRNGTDIRSDPHFNSDVAFVVRRLENYISGKSEEVKEPSAAPLQVPAPSSQGQTVTLPADDPRPPRLRRPVVPDALSFLKRSGSRLGTLARGAFSLLKRARSDSPKAWASAGGLRRPAFVARWTVGFGLGEMVGTALATALGVAILDSAQHGVGIRGATVGAGAACVFLIAGGVGLGQGITVRSLPERRRWVLATVAGWAAGYLIAAWINSMWNRSPWVTNWYGAELSSSALGLPVARLGPFSSGMSALAQHWMFQAMQAALIGGSVAFCQWLVLRRTLFVRLGRWIAVTAAVWALITPTLNYLVSALILHGDRSAWHFEIAGQTALGTVLGVLRGSLIGGFTGLWLAAIFDRAQSPADTAMVRTSH